MGALSTYVSSGPWRALRVVGTGQSDYLHALVRKGYASRVRETLWEQTSTLKDVDLIDFHQWREDFGPGPDDCDQLTQATCLSIDLPSSYEQYLSTIGKSLRFDCRRLDKKPFSNNEARIVDSETIGLDNALDAFFDLHASRWHKRGLPGAFAFKALQSFHKEAARRLAESGFLRLSVLEAEGSAVGAIYAMQVVGTRFFYQCGFDPEKKALSPGTLLVAHAIKSSIEEGSRSFDLMRGDEPYKRRWNPQHSKCNLRYIQSLSTGRGTVGRRINNATAQIEAKVRSRLEGRGLLG